MLICTIEIPNFFDKENRSLPQGYFVVATYRFEPSLEIGDDLKVWWQEHDQGNPKGEGTQLECTVTDKTKEVFPQNETIILNNQLRPLGFSSDEINQSLITGIFWIRIFVEVKSNDEQKWREMCIQMEERNSN